MLNKLFLTFLFIFTFSEAKDSFSSERILGIEVGYASVESADAIGSLKHTKGAEYGVRIGAQNEEWRTTLSLNFYGSGTQSYKRAMLQFDRFVWASLYKTDNIVFKPYLGGYIGYMSFADEGGIYETGMLYGGEAGLAWNVLNEIDFDLGYRYSVTDVSVVADIGSFVFGVNYIY